MTKNEIIEALESSRQDFMEAIEGLSEDELQKPGVVGEWSIKDIMAHISAWEAELIKLLWQVKQSTRPTSAHFSATEVDDLNASWHEETRSRPLDRVLADFESVRKQTMRRVDAFSDEDLNSPKRFPWLGEQPLWEWIANDSFEHEAEHRAQIEEWRSKLLTT